MDNTRMTEHEIALQRLELQEMSFEIERIHDDPFEEHNVTTVGGEILNLDGPLDLAAANELARQIEDENNIDVRVVPAED